MTPNPWITALPAAILVTLSWMPCALTAAINTTAISEQPQQNAATTPPLDNIIIQDIIPKSIITFFGLILFVLIGMGIAKLMDRLHDSVELRDDSSDISEHTRDLLKARLAIFAFTPARLRSDADAKIRDIERARRFGRIWIGKAAQARQKRYDDAQKNILSVVKESSGFAARTNSGMSLTPTTAPSIVTPTVTLTDTDGTVTTNPTTSSSKVMSEKSEVSLHKLKKETATDSKHQEVEEPKVEATNKTVANYLAVDRPKAGANKAMHDKTKADNKMAGNKPTLANKRNNHFIAIDILHMDESTETGEGYTLPFTPCNTYIDFREVSEDVTIPVRVSTNDAPRPRQTMTQEMIPPPRLAYADSEFGSEESLRHFAAPNVAMPSAGPKSGAISPFTNERLEITNLSENSSESLHNHANTARPNTSETAATANIHAKELVAVAKRDSRPVTSGSVASRVTFSRPLTARRAQPMMPGGRGDRASVMTKSPSRRER